MNGRPLALALGMALTACSLAPHYERPAMPVPPREYKEAGSWEVASPADRISRGPWWRVFHDRALDALESEVTSANEDLKAALARLEQSRAQIRIARAGLFPSLEASAAATRSRASLNAPSYVSSKPSNFNDFTTGGDFSYEIDVFGRIRNTVSGARANAQAAAGDAAALDLSLHAALASDYFELEGLDAERALLDQTVTAYTRALELTRNLYRGGAAAISDVQQAEAQLDTATTKAAEIRLRRAQTEHAIAVLVGREASGFHLGPRPLPWEAAPPIIATGLPSQLLERRPDIAAAERRVAAANAAIGVARAAFFPVFSLTGAGGFESAAAANWLQAPSGYWSLGPQGVLSVLDAGLHRAQTAAARASYDEQVAEYRGTVLAAYQDVEDNLAALHELERESISQAAAVAATQAALDQADDRYRGGLVTYLEVVSTENAALQARLSAVDIETRRMTATVQLVEALGGDWFVSEHGGLRQTSR